MSRAAVAALAMSCLLVALASCGSERLQHHALPDIELLMVTACGELPPGDDLVRILITKDAKFVVPGRSELTDIRGLWACLLGVHDSLDVEAGARLRSPLHFVIEADRRASLGVVGSALLASTLSARSARFWLKVRLAPGHDVGAIYIGPPDVLSSGSNWTETLSVKLAMAELPTPPGDVYTTIDASERVTRGQWGFCMEASDSAALGVPWRDVAAILDAVNRATHGRGTCLVTPGPEGSFPADALLDLETRSAFLQNEARVLPFLEQLASAHARSEGAAVVQIDRLPIRSGGALPSPASIRDGKGPSSGSISPHGFRAELDLLGEIEEAPPLLDDPD